MKRTACLLGSFLFFGLSAFACTAQAMSFEEFNTKAMPLLEKPSEATRLLQLCEQALKSAEDPEQEAFIRIIKGQAYFLKKDFAKAEEEARSVIDSGHQRELGYALATQALFAVDRLDEGKKLCLEGAQKENTPDRQAGAAQYCEDLLIEHSAVAARTLWNAYKKDAKAAEKRYGEQAVVVYGTVLRAEKASAEGPRLILRVDKADAQKRVVCVLGPGKSEKADKSEKDDAKSTDEMRYSLNGNDDNDSSDDSAEKTEISAKPELTEEPEASAETADMPLPEKDATVYITGTVRGFDDAQLVLVNCTLH